MSSTTTSRSVFDKNGRLIGKDYLVNGIVTGKDVYTYNSSGIIYSTTKYDASGKLITEVDKYNSAGTIITEIDKYSAGVIYSATKYDATGKIITEVDKYNSAGNAVVEIDKYSAGVLNTVTKYNSSGKMITEIDKYNTAGTVITEVDTYTAGALDYAIKYDSTGKILTEVDKYYAGVINYIVKYDSAGKTITEIDNFDSKGTIVQKTFYKNNAVSEADIYNNGVLSIKAYYTNNILTEADRYSQGVITEKDYYSNNLLTKSDFYTNGSLNTEVLYKNGYIAEKDFYTNNVITEKDLYTNNVLIEKDYLTNGSIREKDLYKNGSISEKDLYTNNVLTEKDLYTNGVINEKDLYKNGSISEKDFYTNSAITERDLYTNNILTEKDYLTNGSVTEKDLYNSSGSITQKLYYDKNGNLLPTPNNNNTNTGVVTTDPSGVKVYDYGQATTWAKYLDYSQGDNSKGYKYDCGLASCENVLIETGVLAKRSSTTIVNGVDTEESTVVNYAAANGYCITSNSNPYYNGGTYGSWQASILNHFGLSALDQYTSLSTIASTIKSGGCVIAEVDAYQLWGMGSAGYANHAITVTGVDYNYSNPTQIDGFYICDSGRGIASDASRFVSYSLMSSVFNLDYSNTVGEAIIVSTNKQQVTSTITSTVAAKGVIGNDIDINALIQQMASYTTPADQQIMANIDAASQQQNLQALVASHAL